MFPTPHSWSISQWLVLVQPSRYAKRETACKNNAAVMELQSYGARSVYTGSTSSIAGMCHAAVLWLERLMLDI